eukprot:scaffold2849_cov174-Amphora_coffeaeformis.AAC.2
MEYDSNKIFFDDARERVVDVSLQARSKMRKIERSVEKRGRRSLPSLGVRGWLLDMCVCGRHNNEIYVHPWRLKTSYRRRSGLQLELSIIAMLDNSIKYIGIVCGELSHILIVP